MYVLFSSNASHLESVLFQTPLTDCRSLWSINSLKINPGGYRRRWQSPSTWYEMASKMQSSENVTVFMCFLIACHSVLGGPVLLQRDHTWVTWGPWGMHQVCGGTDSLCFWPAPRRRSQNNWRETAEAPGRWNYKLTTEFRFQDIIFSAFLKYNMIFGVEFIYKIVTSWEKWKAAKDKAIAQLAGD